MMVSDDTGAGLPYPGTRGPGRQERQAEILQRLVNLVGDMDHRQGLPGYGTHGYAYPGTRYPGRNSECSVCQSLFRFRRSSVEN
eukprot:3339946-Rhodomonas_salina.5